MKKRRFAKQFFYSEIIAVDWLVAIQGILGLTEVTWGRDTLVRSSVLWIRCIRVCGEAKDVVGQSGLCDRSGKADDNSIEINPTQSQISTAAGFSPSAIAPANRCPSCTCSDASSG